MRVLSQFCRLLRLGFVFLVFSALVGCASLPAEGEVVPTRTTLAAFSLEGRFSLRHEGKNYSGRLSWQHQEQNNKVLLSSPLGQGMAEISTSQDGAKIIMSDGRVFASPNVESLTKEILGYPLPLVLLTDWVRGISSDSDRLERDSVGRVSFFRHGAWSIQYGYDGESLDAPPSSVFADHQGEFELRLRIDEWTSLKEQISE